MKKKKTVSWPIGLRPASVRWLVGGALGLGLLLGGCAGREHYFQPDARVGPAPSGSPDSALVTAGRHYADHGWLHRWTFGAHYRRLWALPVVVPVLRLSRLPGRPVPTELGGGFQTTSVTIADSAGHRWVVRTIDKDPYRTLPKVLRRSFVLRLVRDETAAANPFAPLALPVLSRAAGVPYASPQLYYVAATDTTFDRLTPKLRGKVVLVEEKFSGADARRPPGLETSIDLVDTDEALRRRFTSPHHRLDALAFARARLFDLWINDWDRHEGQWTWSVSEAQSAPAQRQSPGREVPGENIPAKPRPAPSAPRTYYRPVPKDRDQTFFRFDDGWLTWLASRRFTIRKLRTMHAHYDDVPGLAWNARFLDARVLADVSAAQFDSLAHDLQARLPDSVIARSLHRWPPPVFAAEGANTAALLRARRDALPQAARAFYDYLAEEPLVVGTDAPERFGIERTAAGQVTITVSSAAADAGQTPPVIFRRTFSLSETHRLRLYGLGAKDEFVIRGPKPRRSLPILIYGGEGEDKVTVAPGASAWGIKVLDTKRGVELPERPDPSGLKRNLAGRGKVKVNAFDREGL